MSESAGFTARHVNHSGRKTVISNLLDAGCAPTEVAQLSGHKNLISLNSYHALSTERQKVMSTIIHKNCTATSVEGPVEDDVTDAEMLELSQNMDPLIDQVLSHIESYEQVPNMNNHSISNNSEIVLDLPIRQSPGGTMSLEHLKNHMFSNCSFHAPVNFIFRK
jgi:hypothetical protein